MAIGITVRRKWQTDRFRSRIHYTNIPTNPSRGRSTFYFHSVPRDDVLLQTTVTRRRCRQYYFLWSLLWILPRLYRINTIVSVCTRTNVFFPRLVRALFKRKCILNRSKLGRVTGEYLILCYSTSSENEGYFEQ